MTQTYYVVVNAQGRYLNGKGAWTSELHLAKVFNHRSTPEALADINKARVHIVTMTLGPELT